METQPPVIFDLSITDTRFDWVLEASEELKERLKKIEALSEISQWTEGFFVSAYPENISEALKRSSKIIPIGVYNKSEETLVLDDAGAWFLTDQKEELLLLTREKKKPFSVSFVLLAYNEEGAIQKSILDCDRFLKTYASDYEIVVVDDGSHDQTQKRIKELQHPKVNLVVHEKNGGMGASMRSGYLNSTKDFIAPLPGDRQVRACTLISFLKYVSESNSVVSTYRELPSGKQRGVLSIIFRTILKLVAGLEVNFAGSYMFHRNWLKAIDPASIHYHSYLFSFEVLRRLKKGGSTFSNVQIRPFPRLTGVSTEFQVRRMLYVLKELFSVRLGFQRG